MHKQLVHTALPVAHNKTQKDSQLPKKRKKKKKKKREQGGERDGSQTRRCSRGCRERWKQGPRHPLTARPGPDPLRPRQDMMIPPARHCTTVSQRSTMSRVLASSAHRRGGGERERKEDRVRREREGKAESRRVTCMFLVLIWRISWRPFSSGVTISISLPPPRTSRQRTDPVFHFLLFLFFFRSFSGTLHSRTLLRARF